MPAPGGVFTLSAGAGRWISVSIRFTGYGGKVLTGFPQRNRPPRWSVAADSPLVSDGSIVLSRDGSVLLVGVII